MTARLLTPLMIASLMVSSSCREPRDDAESPCLDVECGAHGLCRVYAGSPFCACEAGFHPEGLTCRANDEEDPCSGVTCSGVGTCEVIQGQPRCLCSLDSVPDRSGLICLPLPNDQPLEEEVLVQGITRVSACMGGDIWIETVWNLATNLGTSALNSLYRCILNARDCEGVLQCESGLTGELCDVETDGHECVEPDVARFCETMNSGAGAVRLIDCADIEESTGSCVIREGLPRCEPLPEFACSPEGAFWCEGDRAFTCLLGIETWADCSDDGKTCYQLEEVSICVDPERTCTHDSCRDDLWIRCVGGRYEREPIDCSVLGEQYTCNDSASGAYCGPRGGDILCLETEARCLGSVAEVCVFGGWVQIDCGTFLDGTCVIEDGQYARCAIDDWP